MARAPGLFLRQPSGKPSTQRCERAIPEHSAASPYHVMSTYIASSGRLNLTLRPLQRGASVMRAPVALPGPAGAPAPLWPILCVQRGTATEWRRSPLRASSSLASAPAPQGSLPRANPTPTVVFQLSRARGGASLLLHHRVMRPRVFFGSTGSSCVRCRAGGFRVVQHRSHARAHCAGHALTASPHLVFEVLTAVETGPNTGLFRIQKNRMSHGQRREPRRLVVSVAGIL